MIFVADPSRLAYLSSLPHTFTVMAINDASMPKIIVTIINSMSVNPLFKFFISNSLVNLSKQMFQTIMFVWGLRFEIFPLKMYELLGVRIMYKLCQK